MNGEFLGGARANGLGLCFPTLRGDCKKQVPFGCAQGRLSTTLRFAQNDLRDGAPKVFQRSHRVRRASETAIRNVSQVRAGALEYVETGRALKRYPWAIAVSEMV